MIMGSIGAIVLARIAQASHLVELALDRYALVSWAAVFVLSLASLKPLAMRQEQAAISGWLAALPPMPDSARRYSTRLLGLSCLVQVVLLVGMLAMLSPGFSNPLAGVHWLLALTVPAAATLTALRLSTSTSLDAGKSQGIQRLSPRTTGNSLAIIVRQWQWAAFRQVLWTPAIRWAIGALLLLIPVGASIAGVAITLLVGWAVFQASNAWAAWMRAINTASRLLRALPTSTIPLLWAFSVWPLVLAVFSGLLLFLGLLALGAAWPVAILAMLLLQAVATLILCAVLAWRHEPRLPQWRISSVVLIWALLAQSLAPAAPWVWLALVAFLLRKAIRR
ncbi:MAG: hypothetical protein EA418_09470 [Wenzhouxiangellaceae bacterium]|nr:MAG: hypothetical protein EA418_09470 [Wenzhouxiangellaceae bacterium]